MEVPSREELSAWILTDLVEADVRWLFKSVVSKHRNLIEQILAEADEPPNVAALENQKILLEPSDKLADGTDGDTGDAGLGMQMTMDASIMARVGECPISDSGKLDAVLEREMVDWEKSNDEAPIVQFSSPMYFCSVDEEDYISLALIRIGNLSSRSEVTFKTKDASAKAGEKFVATSQRIVFEEGSNNEELRIPLLKSSKFDTTTEFKVQLLTEPTPTNCTIGRYLYISRVKVIDGNCFPTNKYSALIHKREVDRIPFWGLFCEYMKFNWSNVVVKRGSIKVLLVEVLHSLYLLLKLFTNVYLVDTIISANIDNADMHLAIISVLLVIGFGILHVLEFRKTTWKVGGGSRALLQNCLLRKFLNYSQDCRADLKSADIIMAMTRDVNNVVHQGYVKMMDLAGSVTNLFAILAFQVSAPFVFDKKLKLLGFGILGIYPIILVSYLLVRRLRTSQVIKAKNDEQDELVATVDRTVHNYRLIADFGQRPFFEARFSKRIGSYNKATTEANQVLTNNKLFGPWITVIFAAAYTVFGGLEVLDDTIAKEDRLSLGMFLANLSIITTIGSSTGSIYNILMDIEMIRPALMQIVHMINLPTDVPQRKALNRDRRGRTDAMREEMRKSLKRGWPADNLPILMEGLKYHFTHGKDSAKGFEMTGTLRLHQGEFSALVGPPAEGKSTLLQMLGGVILPTPGSLFVPSHLRILHVATENLFFKASLFENITFGCIPGDSDADPARVVKICERLGLPSNVMDYVRQGTSGPALVWSELLSHSHKCLLGVARAMITNPELMCIHKPVMAYTESITQRVLAMLKEFCVENGVESDPGTRHLRRPRTCVITASKVASVSLADHIFLVSHKYGIRNVPKELAESFMSGGRGSVFEEQAVPCSPKVKGKDVLMRLEATEVLVDL